MMRMEDFPITIRDYEVLAAFSGERCELFGESTFSDDGKPCVFMEIQHARRFSELFVRRLVSELKDGKRDLLLVEEAA